MGILERGLLELPAADGPHASPALIWWWCWRLPPFITTANGPADCGALRDALSFVGYACCCGWDYRRPHSFYWKSARSPWQLSLSANWARCSLPATRLP